jgi:UDP-N-acetylmuramoyl-tripeptide--D-alanyl-D-alanine ligase
VGGKFEDVLVTSQLTGLVQRFGKFVRRRAVFNLALLARRRNRHTKYIAVTGSSTKTTTCSLLVHILQPYAPTAGHVLSNTMPTIAPFVRTVDESNDFAVIETGIDGPDRMHHLARLIQPHVGVITMIGLEHRARMRSTDVVAAEKGILIEQLAPHGIALLNADDEKTDGIAARARGKVITFGQDKPADYRAVAVSADFPERLSLTIKGPEFDIDLQTQLVGKHFWLPVTAAVACACHLGVPAETIAQQVASFAPPIGRCTVMKLPNNRIVLADTYKAPQHSLHQAFDMIRSASVVHKRIVLGQLSDATGSSTTAYRRAYRLAREAADEVIFVGEHAHRHNASQDDIANGRIRDFREVREVADYLRDTAIDGELILLKSNTKLHLERAALAQMETVRCWESNCGFKTQCSICEFYKNPRQQPNTDQAV